MKNYNHLVGDNPDHKHSSLSIPDLPKITIRIADHFQGAELSSIEITASGETSLEARASLDFAIERSKIIALQGRSNPRPPGVG